MVNSSTRQRVSTVGTLALTALSFAPLRATPAQEDGVSGQQSRSSSTAPLDTSLTLPSLPDTQDSFEKLPDRIVGLAYERGISLSDVKLEGNQWVACVAGACQLLTKALPEEIAAIRKERTIEGLHVGDRLAITGHAISEHTVEGETSYGIPRLGTFNRQADGTITFRASPDFSGTITKAASPKISGHSLKAVIHGRYPSPILKELRDSLASEPGTTFVIVISVPGLCGPCRQYVSDINAAAASFPQDSKVKFFVVDFDTFEEARAKVGKIKAFPATIVLPSTDVKPKVESLPDQSLPLLTTVKRPGFQLHGQVASDKLRACILGAQRKVEGAQSGISHVTADYLTQQR